MQWPLYYDPTMNNERPMPQFHTTNNLCYNDNSPAPSADWLNSHKRKHKSRFSALQSHVNQQKIGTHQTPQTNNETHFPNKRIKSHERANVPIVRCVGRRWHVIYNSGVGGIAGGTHRTSNTKIKLTYFCETVNLSL